MDGRQFSLATFPLIHSSAYCLICFIVVRIAAGAFVKAVEDILVEVFHVEILVSVEVLVQVEGAAGSCQFFKIDCLLGSFPCLLAAFGTVYLFAGDDLRQFYEEASLCNVVEHI